MAKQSTLDWHGCTMSSIEACIVSIRADTIDFGKALDAEQYAELSRIYDAALALQRWVVFGERPNDAGQTEIARLENERDELIATLKEIASKATSEPEAEPRGGYAPWAFGVGLDHGRWECAEEARAALAKVQVKKE